MTTITSKNKNRIDVWPESAIAQEARSGSSKALGRMTVWDSTSEARGHLSYDDGGGSSPYAVIADFKNGTYTVNGASVDVSTIFQNDDLDGDPFVPESIQPGVGYVGPDSGDNGASLAGAALAAALPSATMVFEFTLTRDLSAQQGIMAVLVYSSPSGYPTNRFNIANWTEAPDAAVLQDSVYNAAGLAHDLGLVVGLNKIAISYAVDRLSISTNGGAVMTLANPVDFDDTSNTVTPYFFSGLVMETIKVRSIVADADLPALSALS